MCRSEKLTNKLDDLIASYTNTHYQVDTPTDSFTMRINQYSQPLAQLLIRNHCVSATIITAYNPHSQKQSHQKNRDANEKLLQTLIAHTDKIYPSQNIDPSGIWPTEYSYCALGLNLDLSKQIGREFNQNAIVWSDLTERPQLILL